MWGTTHLLGRKTIFNFGLFTFPGTVKNNVSELLVPISVASKR